MSRPTLIVDFDGVLHEYRSKWTRADEILDGPVPGAQEFCRAASLLFRVLIVSTRSSQAGGADAIRAWLVEHDFPPESKHFVVSETGVKEPCLVTLDDRAVRFQGVWPDPEYLLALKPWNKP